MLLGMRNQGLMSLKLISDSVKNLGLEDTKVVIAAEAEGNEEEAGELDR